jgi:MoxR-like ATPase
VPAFRVYQKQRNDLVARSRARLRLDEFRPKVMSAFVRNRLLDEVYLPLIGDNLAKQLGAVGDAKRTDQMGLLLLISPPGYGKTTLMEYVANRLGLVFVKVNGPALGHEVTSLDPAEAPNATARQEVEKITFALELGNNALLYLDDIQHTNPELLQKFISLCDAQRRMEGVWQGRTRTYDMRGKRFAVCMAGNPYTEQGKRFRIPDMLANRADVWNLGDVLSGREELFALSYIENSLTSNPVLAPLSTRERADIELLVRLARGDSAVRSDQLSHGYSAVELDQVLSVLRKLVRVQQVVLANNRAYIASAAQSDAARTEPPFQLQGSYRNMNKLAERIVPVMNDAELESLIDDHYVGEAQTLTSGAEANLLKLASLRGRLSAAQASRWSEVKAAYLREKALGGAGDDPLDRAVGAVGLLADRVAAVETAITRTGHRLADR